MRNIFLFFVILHINAMENEFDEQNALIKTSDRSYQSLQRAIDTIDVKQVKDILSQITQKHDKPSWLYSEDERMQIMHQADTQKTVLQYRTKTYTPSSRKQYMGYACIFCSAGFLLALGTGGILTRILSLFEQSEILTNHNCYKNPIVTSFGIFEDIAAISMGIYILSRFMNYRTPQQKYEDANKITDALVTWLQKNNDLP